MRYDVLRWQQLAHQLLTVHFGIDLNDTDLSDEVVAGQMLDAGITPAEAINHLVDKFGLVKLKASDFIPRSSYVSEADELVAQVQSAGALTLVVTPDNHD